MSRVKVNEITNKVATGPVDFPDGITGVALTVTGNVTVGGTIISEDTTNVDSVGWVTARSGLNVGPPSTGIGATVHSNGNAVFAGIVTTGNLTAGSGTFNSAISGTTGTFTGAVDVTGQSTFRDRLQIISSTPDILLTKTGGGLDSRIHNDGSGNLIFGTGTDSDTPTERLRITSSGGLSLNNGELVERCNVTAGKLSDNQTINLDNGMVHLFTTTETTTATPNIMSTAGINTSMSNGDAITVTLITTAAAGAYCANIQVDGAAVTENWIGGSAPSDGGSSGVDVHTFSIIKTASETFTVLGNQSKTS